MRKYQILLVPIGLFSIGFTRFGEYDDLASVYEWRLSLGPIEINKWNRDFMGAEWELVEKQ